MKELLKSV